MANAEGGYILIGVDEKNKIAQGFFTVPDADKVAISIRDTCLQSVDPRIPNFEVMRYPHPLEWKNKDIELVIIHIPPSEARPHSFRWKNSTNFVKRYGDITREYPVSELIQDLLVRYHPPVIGQIDSKLATILKNTQMDRRDTISPQDDALGLEEVDHLVHLMKLRFEEAISDQPYYRILATPTILNPNAVSTQDEHIRQIMYNPPDRRYGNFGVTGILRDGMARSSEGINGPNITGGEITLLKNGFLEVRCPLRDTQFQWRREESRISEDWLYPYVVCEFPVTFLRLVKTIYAASGINSSIFIQQEYHNLTGFMLPKGNPANIGFAAFQDERNVYKHSHPIVSKRTIDSNFIPDHETYKLVIEVYDYFGLEPQWIPAFDENGNFTLE